MTSRVLLCRCVHYRCAETAASCCAFIILTTALAHTSVFWGSSAIRCLSSTFSSLRSLRSIFRESQDSNPGGLGEKCIRHLCAMPSPLAHTSAYFHLRKSSSGKKVSGRGETLKPNLNYSSETNAGRSYDRTFKPT